MKRIETVYERLCELAGENGITTIELAEDLSLARPNVSEDLNKLCDEGRATKEGTKPVRYKAVVQEKSRSALDQFAARNPSLSQAVEQAKAAILYPPRGMPILILGETGSGKSLFAKLIHDFALSVRGTQVMPFIVFNCADYADNASLLVSHLFGAKKGAYTGADEDRMGLLEKANGGILFLDEVHRLPPEGQEMLFSFLDRGTFRRLGDSDAERSATVQIIAATTEASESVLLRTFTRRIPMIVRLPPLSQRTLDERLKLIEGFYSDEASRIGMPIHVSVNSIRSLLGYPCQNNVGQLKTDIQLLCARAYSDYVSEKKSTVQIVTANLPGYIKEGLFSGTAHREVWYKLTDVGSRFCVFSAGQTDEESSFGMRDNLNIYEMIDLRLREMRSGGVKENEIEQNIDAYIRSYFSRFCSYQNETTTMEGILNMADADIATAIREILSFAEKKLGRAFTDSIATGIAMHVMNAINRVKSGRQINNPEFNRIRRDHPEEFAVAIECLKLIDHACEISMPLEEASFLTFFFLIDEDRNKASGTKQVSVIVMAHGDSTASSMARACNGLLGLNVAMGIDVPLSEPPGTAWTRLKTFVAEQNGTSDILLLVDMGSLTNLGKMLETELGIKSKTLPMVSTLHVLQAARKAAEGLPLERIYEDVRDIRDVLNAEPEPAQEKIEKPRRRKYILTICSTGEGTALMLRDRLQEALCFNRNKIQIINLGIAGQESVQERLERIGNTGQIVFIVSPFHFDIEVPQFTIADVSGTERITAMQALVDQESLMEKTSEAFADFFTSIDPDDAFRNARVFIERIEREYGCILLDTVRTGIFCHIACMLDRLKSGAGTQPFADRESFMAANQNLVNIVRAEAVSLERQFRVSVSDDEICHIASFFHPDNCGEIS